jgi:N-methylhydantoinase B
MRPVSMSTEPGTVVHATSPAPVATNGTYQSQVGNAVMKAMEQVVPERVGEVGMDLVITMHMGRDMRYPEQPIYVNVDYLMSAIASSAAYGVDGWGAWPSVHSSNRVNTVEMTEVQEPVLYLQGEYVTDTAAPGRWRGTPAFHLKRRNPDNQTVFWNIPVVYAEGRGLPGWAGGDAGVGNYVITDHGGPNEHKETIYAHRYLSRPGEVIFAQSGGGGGWGPSFDRDPGAVLDDVLDDFVSIEAAARDYGVAIDPVRLVVLEEETRALREAGRQTPVRGARLPSPDELLPAGQSARIATGGLTFDQIVGSKSP